MNERVERLQKKMQEEGLGACVISDHSAVEYFIGRRFSCGERLIALIVTTEGLPKLVLNELFPLAPQTDFELVRYNDTEDGVQIVSRFLNGKVGIDKFWSAGFLIRLMALRPDLEMVDGNRPQLFNIRRQEAAVAFNYDFRARMQLPRPVVIAQSLPNMQDVFNRRFR